MSDDITWIDATLASIIAPYCREAFGAQVSVPTTRSGYPFESEANVPRRSLGLTSALARAVAHPPALRPLLTAKWPDPRPDRTLLLALADEYIVVFRDRRPIGPDSVIVGVGCAHVFLALNDSPVQWNSRRVAGAVASAGGRLWIERPVAGR